MKAPIFVNDGDTLVLVASAPITVSDPTDEFPGVSQAYRVVADRVSPTLVLVPLRETPVKVSRAEIRELAHRTAKERLNELLEFLNHDIKAVLEFVTASLGRKDNTKLITSTTGQDVVSGKPTSETVQQNPPFAHDKLVTLRDLPYHIPFRQQLSKGAD